MTKKIIATLVATAMFLLTTFGTTVSATATVNTTETVTPEATSTYSNAIPENAEILYEFDVTLDQLRSITLLDKNWNFVGSYTDINRSYMYKTIGFSVQCSDSGNSGDTIRIELIDNTNTCSQLFTAYSDGGLYGFNNISIIKNRSYHFEFTDITNSTTAVSLHFIIYH